MDIDKVRINKRAKILTHAFSSVFTGFENVDAVKRIFKKNTEKVLSKLRVALYSSSWGGYLWIDEKNGIIVCNLDYIRSADKRYVYLDVIHELVHIRQLMQGKKLFDENFEYVHRPTEIEAYRVAVDEAKGMGMSRKEIIDYLKVEWISKGDFVKFLKTLKV